MPELLNFFLNHWILSGALLLALIAVIIFEYKFAEQKVDISVEKAVSLMNHEGAHVLDIRKEEDFAKGHIINAVNVQLTELNPENKKFMIKYGKKPIIVVCYKGVSSARAISSLKLMGANSNSVFSLSGGMGAWLNANLPLVK